MDRGRLVLRKFAAPILVVVCLGGQAVGRVDWGWGEGYEGPVGVDGFPVRVGGGGCCGSVGGGDGATAGSPGSYTAKFGGWDCER